VPNGAGGEYKNTLQENNFPFVIGMEWKPQPGVLIYANVARGYKAGGFPLIAATSMSQFHPVTQESVLSYEGGFKASLFDRLLQLNAAAFYYDYKNKQVRSKIIDATFGIEDVLQNIPKSSVKGFEIESDLKPTRNLVINSTFTYVDAKIDQFSGVNAGGVQANFGGTSIPFTPKYQLGSNVDWTIPVSQSMNVIAGGSLNYRSGTFAVVGGNLNPPAAVSPVGCIYCISGYTTVDLRLGLADADGRWRATIWGKNITNKYYWNNVVAGYDTIGRYTVMPATYGVSLSLRY
jgi:outer membrane receptor protein involved in Fe transport